MALPVREQLTYWGAAIAVFFVVLWLLGDVITPFLLGAAIAYFLDPVADRLERLGASRIVAVIVIMLSLVLVTAACVLLIAPMLIEQATQLVRSTPAMFTQLQTWLTGQFPALMDTDSSMSRSLQGIGEAVQARGGELLNRVLSSAMGVISVLLLLFIVPVVTFYLLLDWDQIVAHMDEMLPRDHAPTIRSLAQSIDRALSSFVRGQGTVCLIMAVFYGTTLMAVGLQFGLVVGLLSGLLAFIPFVSSILGGVFAIGLAIFQFWGAWPMIALVAVIYIGGQILEGNVLTPKLVGSSVGLHPVWVIFALSAFGAVFGFVGLLVAVPVAAALGVLARFAIQQYLDSRLYKGLTWHHVDLDSRNRGGDDA
ncbi:putative PurR-regulated permease PerM [Rhodovulum bhavnagarense]|uniref:Putative PurR-regulated permease PerM n=1 Tax=Rhodovulum bhavnagarense TaxID=992286 RepID=A0A4V2SWE7_9RHOB|nr:AI-2E family transporter [Rhodovulum bhavnagarense]TCP62186.1 putative PurR-regulated permease PerM [Rhodovulum bhavnagarense]